MPLKIPAPPREIGQLKTDYAPLPADTPVMDHITSIKMHMQDLTKDEWEQLAREVRNKAVVRLVNDNVLIALLKLWAVPNSKPDRPASPSRSDQAVSAEHPADERAEKIRQLEAALKAHRPLFESSRAATLATPQPAGLPKEPKGCDGNPSESNK